MVDFWKLRSIDVSVWDEMIFVGVLPNHNVNYNTYWLLLIIDYY